MATNLDIYVNTTAVDDTRIAQPGNFVLLDTTNDKLIWSAGSASVADGLATPSNSELNEATTIIQPTDTEIDKLFLLDFSDTGAELKEVNLAGSTDTQFVINFSFDGPTVSEPTLEAYDTNAHTTANLNALGIGTPADSMLKAVLTTAGLPGAGWVGTPIAGAVLPNILQLNAGGGGLGGATEIYANLKVVIPGAFSTAFTETPVITIRYTFS